MSKLNELILASRAASNAHSALYDEQREWVRTRQREIRDQAGALYGERLTALRDSADEAQRAYEAEKVAATLTWADIGWTVGARMQKTARNRGSNRRIVTAQGVVEVWSDESLRPDNKRYLPYTGDVVVRLLKADGTPSLRYDNYRTGWEVVVQEEEA